MCITLSLYFYNRWVRHAAVPIFGETGWSVSFVPQSGCLLGIRFTNETGDLAGFFGACFVHFGNFLSGELPLNVEDAILTQFGSQRRRWKFANVVSHDVVARIETAAEFRELVLDGVHFVSRVPDVVVPNVGGIPIAVSFGDIVIEDDFFAFLFDAASPLGFCHVFLLQPAFELAQFYHAFGVYGHGRISVGTR